MLLNSSHRKKQLLKRNDIELNVCLFEFRLEENKLHKEMIKVVKMYREPTTVATLISV